MNVGLVGRSAAVRLRRAGVAIKEFFGPIEAAGSRTRAAAPFCAWYGRAVFCMHWPEPQPRAEAGEDRISQRTRFTSAESPR